MSASQIAIRAGCVVVAVALWFWSQKAISEAKAPPMEETGIGDRLHSLTTPWLSWLSEKPRRADALLIATSMGIDLFGLYLLGAAVFGHTIRPLISLLIVFALRQVCQLLVSLPDPPGMIWRYPGFPTLLVTYHVENDFFFSGHTAVSVVGALALIHAAPVWIAALGALLAAVEATTVIVLRAHYTMDVFAAIMAAGVADVAAGWIAPHVDTLLRSIA
jgi:hypothetical protein